MKRGAKHAHRTNFNRPVRHVAAPVAPPKRAARDDAWRLRAVLSALATGGRIILDRTKMAWYAIKTTGGKLRIKWPLMLELRRDFVDHALRLTNWGRYAAQAVT